MPKFLTLKLDESDNKTAYQSIIKKYINTQLIKLRKKAPQAKFFRKLLCFYRNSSKFPPAIGFDHSNIFFLQFLTLKILELGDEILKAKICNIIIEGRDNGTWTQAKTKKKIILKWNK